MKKKQKCEISQDFLGFWLHTQNPRRFAGFAVVVVVTFFSMTSSTMSMLFVRNVSFLKKIDNQLGGLTVFRRKMAIFIEGETKHILPTKTNEQFAKVSPSNNNYSFSILNHSTTATSNQQTTEAHRAKQRSTKEGYTPNCASWDWHECDPTARSKRRWEDYYATQEHMSTERAIPELVTWQGQKCITVRCPPASRYGGGTASPTETAEDEQHKGYESGVTPIAFSTYERLGLEGRSAIETLAAEAHWNFDDPSNQRSQVAKWRNTLEQRVLHAQTDVLLLFLDGEECTGWQRHAGTRLGRQRTAATHSHKLSDQQAATIKANRVLAEARRGILKAQGEPGDGRRGDGN